MGDVGRDRADGAHARASAAGPGAVPADRRTVAARVTGTVQGVGFRPFVRHLATTLGLSGEVGNDAQGVFLEATGESPAIETFLRRLTSEAPPLAVVEAVEVTRDRPAPVADAAGIVEPGFRIVASADAAGEGRITSIPPDTAVCGDCLAEMRDPDDRRFGYPFIACTNCGPRYTITTGLPYDRASTTMADFPLCPECRAEYEDPASRRFHAQPTACSACGPALSLPVRDVVAALATGAIVAIKGVGGYHLACDARDAAAVARLRERKQRGAKPFAVMVPDVATARRIVRLGPEAEAQLHSRARPIVLADSQEPALQDSVAPGTGMLGVMLAYAPLHHLLFDAGAPSVLVMTSGNLSDEPICIANAEAEQRLRGIADVFCHHDRRIHVACDDSVVRLVAGGPQPVRRSRGYAPVPVGLPLAARPIAAVGGELKSVVAVASGRRAWLSQHIGDTENLETLAMLARTLETLAALQQVRPEVLVSDAHPGYLSNRWAAEHAAAHGVQHLVVQHHHAHLASLLAERGVPAGVPVLGVVFDGTGYGGDGTIWGGELLLGSYGSVQRVGHLRPVLLPGGDAAIRQPARSAVAHLAAAGLDVAGTASADALGPTGTRVLGQMLASGSGCVATTSAGRLFDAVASLLGVRHEIDYEAHAAMELEALATWGDAQVDAWPDADLGRPGGEGGVSGPVLIDPAPWITRAVEDHAEGMPARDSARAFHDALARAVRAAAQEVRARHGVATVGLTGGVFANARLAGECVTGLEADGFRVLTHRLVPPNDGGLALGQVAVAAAGGARPRL